MVVGNTYSADNVLPNAGPDAAGMAAALQELGFHVIYVRETSRADLTAAIDRFRNAAEGADVGLFYFAGHAVQLRGRNYLLPVGVTIAALSDVPREAIDLEQVLRVLGDLPLSTRLVFLDACRVNPFPQQFMSGLPASRDWVQGLAPPSNAPPSTMISFSTEPGRTASDGTGVNSPYTAALLKRIREPGVLLERMLQTVRQDVIDSTAPDQVPWDNSSIKAPFMFRSAGWSEVLIDSGDDEVYFSINGAQVASWSADGNRNKRFALNIGRNAFTVDVANQKTYTPGILRLPEGWHYSLTMTLPPPAGGEGSHAVKLAMSEDVPAKDGPRHGGRFRVADGELFVDPASGRVTVTALRTTSLR